MKINSMRQNICAVLAAMIWGSAFVAQSIGADYLGPFTFNAARSAVAFLFLLALCAARYVWKRRAFPAQAEKKSAGNILKNGGDNTGGINASFRELLFAGGCCGTALTVASYFQQKGMETTSSGKAGFITALYIVIVPILSIFLNRKAPRAIWISVILAVIGLYCLCINESFTISTGDFFVLLCAFCFSVQIMTIDHFTQKTDGIALSCVQFLTVTLLSLLGTFVFRETVTLSALTACVGPILYAGIFSSGIAYTLQILAQKDSNPTVISLLMSLEAVFATISGALILHDHMSGKEYLGCALMFAAVLLAQIPRRAETAPAGTRGNSGADIRKKHAAL